MSTGDDVDDALQIALALLDDSHLSLHATEYATGAVGAPIDCPAPQQQQQQYGHDWTFHDVDELLAMSMDDDDETDVAANGSSLSMTLINCASTADGPIQQTQRAPAAPRVTSSTSSSKRQLLSKRSNASGGKAKTYGNPNKARDGRKEELIYMRKKVAELEQQLADTKQRQRLQQIDTKTAEGPSLAGPIQSRRTTEPSVWAEIVRRQQTQRAMAERENIRLKLVLENQLKVAKSLEKMVQKSSCTKEFDKVLPDRQRFVWAAHSPPPPPHATDARLIDELLAGLDQSYVEAESVFEANGLARAVGDTHVNATIQTNDTGAVQLVIVASKVLPFDMRAAGAVVWNHFAFAKDRLPNRMYHHNAPQMLNAAEDTIVEDFNLEIVMNTAVAMYRERQVMRKYTEEHRVVIVWRGYSDTVRIADEPTDGMRFFERGYIVIRQADDAASSPRNVLQTCYLTTPVSNGTLADADVSKIRGIADYIIRSTADKISSSHEIIENLLLEQAMKAQ